MLQGFTVGVTSDRSWDVLAQQFERRGVTVVHGASLETRTLSFGPDIRDATERLVARPPDALIAATAIGMDHWLAGAREAGLGPQILTALRSARVYPRGAKAATALAAAGLWSEPGSAEVPDRLSDVVSMVVGDLRPGMRVAVQVDGSGSAAELASLRAAGLEMEVISTYRWGPPRDRRPSIRLAEGVIAGRVHAVTFTARPALQIWFGIAAEEGIADPLRACLSAGQVIIGCIGPVCAEAVTAEGVTSDQVVVPASHHTGDLAQAVCDRLGTRVIRTRQPNGEAGVELVGTVATIGGQSYQLSPAEARLLGALVGSPNAVLTPTELLVSVWEGAAKDPQLVEMVVARLRRRLGANAHLIAAVPRRGYSLRQ
jgi:uroporphyrinogen-III synthase